VAYILPLPYKGLTARSTTELRPLKSGAELSSWSIDGVAWYIADAESVLTPYSDLFQKHYSHQVPISVFCFLPFLPSAVFSL